MRTKRSDEAYLLIDHRNSPGISQEFITANKLDSPAVPGGVVFESAIVLCHSCGADIILNPNRSRPREYCMIHDAYLCDWCALRRKITGSCVPLRQKIMEIYNWLCKQGESR